MIQNKSYGVPASYHQVPVILLIFFSHIQDINPINLLMFCLE